MKRSITRVISVTFIYLVITGLYIELLMTLLTVADSLVNVVGVLTVLGYILFTKFYFRKLLKLKRN